MNIKLGDRAYVYTRNQQDPEITTLEMGTVSEVKPTAHQPRKSGRQPTHVIGVCIDSTGGTHRRFDCDVTVALTDNVIDDMVSI